MFCQDRDILCVEPVVYQGQAIPPIVQPASGTDGVISAGTFTSPSADFVGAGVRAGMVLCTTSTIISEGSVWEIVDVVSATQLAISSLRASADGPVISAGNATGPKYYVRTLMAAIEQVSSEISERFRRLGESNGIVATDFSDSRALAAATAFGVLARIYRGMAATVADDVRWMKAEHYAGEYERMCSRLRLSVDANGDGIAEQTRSLGNVRLRRD